MGWSLGRTGEVEEGARERRGGEEEEVGEGPRGREGGRRWTNELPPRKMSRMGGGGGGGRGGRPGKDTLERGAAINGARAR